MSPDVPLVGGIPLVGPILNRLDENTRLLAQTLDDQAHLMASLPKTLQSANEAIAALSQTIVTLDKNVQRANRLAEPLLDRLEQIVGLLDRADIRDIPDVLTTLTRDTLPALREAAKTQQQLAGAVASIDNLVRLLEDLLSRLGEFPGAGLIRGALNLASPRPVTDEARTDRPRPAPTPRPTPARRPGSETSVTPAAADPAGTDDTARTDAPTTDGDNDAGGPGIADTWPAGY